MSMEVRRRYTPILTPKVLWITDTGEEILDRVRFSPTVVASAIEGLQRLENEDFDVVLASLPEREESAVAVLLEHFQQMQPTTPIVIYAPGARATEIVRLLRLGAFHMFEHGDASSLIYLAANSKWAQESKKEPGYSDHEPWRRLLIGQSRPMEQVIEKIRLVA